MVGHHNRLARYLFKRGPYRLVEGRAALEADIVTDFASADDSVEIIGNYRIAQTRDKVFGGRSQLLIAQQIRFHKNGATLA